MPERSAWPISVLIASRPGPLSRTRPRPARRGSVPLGKSPDLHAPPQDMDVRSERETRRDARHIDPGNVCIEGHRDPGIEFVAALDGRGQDRLSETESAPASTEEKTAVALRTPRDD